MSETEVHTLFEGIQPASCYSWYDETFKACKSECKVSQFCKPATARRIKGVVPNPTPPPPPPPLPEPVPEPAPLDYLLDSLRGKYDVTEKLDLSNDKFDVYDVKKDGQMFVRAMMSKDGSNRVCFRSRSSSPVFVVDSIETAETVLAKLM